MARKPSRARQWSLYLLRCRDGALYTGIALDVAARCRAHAEGTGAKALRGRGPLAVVFAVRIGDRGAAQSLESRVKRLPKVEKERLVASRSFARQWLAGARAAVDQPKS
ncbi:MAG: GIY-YIG nuclease family protein [Planctomycetota bacterium]